MDSPETSSASDEANKSERQARLDDDHPATDAVRTIFERLGDFREQAGLFVAARWDRVRLSARQAMVWAALGVVAMFGVLSIVAAAIAMLVMGIARGLRPLFVPHAWIGDVLTGVLVLAALAGGVALAIARLRRSWRRKLLAKYEERVECQGQEGTLAERE